MRSTLTSKVVSRFPVSYQTGPMTYLVLASHICISANKPPPWTAINLSCLERAVLYVISKHCWKSAIKRQSHPAGYCNLIFNIIGIPDGCRRSGCLGQKFDRECRHFWPTHQDQILDRELFAIRADSHGASMCRAGAHSALMPVAKFSEPCCT